MPWVLSEPALQTARTVEALAALRAQVEQLASELGAGEAIPVAARRRPWPCAHLQADLS